MCLFLFSHLRADGRGEKRKKERKWPRYRERRERGKRVGGNAFPRPCVYCTIPQLFALPKEGGGGGRQKVVLKTTIFLSRGRSWGEEPMFGILSLRGKQNEIRKNGVQTDGGKWLGVPRSPNEAYSSATNYNFSPDLATTQKSITKRAELPVYRLNSHRSQNTEKCTGPSKASPLYTHTYTKPANSHFLLWTNPPLKKSCLSSSSSGGGGGGRERGQNGGYPFRPCWPSLPTELHILHREKRRSRAELARSQAGRLCVPPPPFLSSSSSSGCTEAAATSDSAKSQLVRDSPRLN